MWKLLAYGLRAPIGSDVRSGGGGDPDLPISNPRARPDRRVQILQVPRSDDRTESCSDSIARPGRRAEKAIGS
ncbi:hypothetical protein BRC86_06355 [Halobacteriales archaeon QS_3_64_16]|nr:MAG: hypothetical protein BRC86_06355 [Halobacteriales archaeon QS_3_64_16]